MVQRPSLRELSFVLALAMNSSSVDRAFAQEPDPDATDPAPQATITPPRVVRSEDPVYPPEQLADGGPRVVEFLVVIDADGRLAGAEVERSAGDAFDRAALESLARWVFEPAHRDATPIASRVRVSVHFELPTTDLRTERTQDAPDADDVERAPSLDDDVIRATAVVDAAPLRSVDRSASEVYLDRETLGIAPHRDAGEMLRAAPGFVVTRPEGDAIAHRIVLRGFDAEHGQDIELSVAGIPLNQPSHLHGQGYADLTFLVPEVVRGIRVREGVYDPVQGDFAVAGSVDFELGTDRRGITAITQFGSFGTFRAAMVVAPDDEEDDTFVAVEARRTRGFGDHRSAIGASGLAQWGFGVGGYRLRLIGALAGSRADLAGVVRTDDHDTVGFYRTYDDPSVRAQNAFAARALVGLLGERRGVRGRSTDLAVFLGFTDFRSQTNLTGYTQVSRFEPTWRGRGDLIEQRNQATTLGLRVRHRTARITRGRFGAALEAGTSARIDRTEQSQALLEQPQNQTWDRRIDATVVGADLGFHLEAELSFGERLTLRGGVRADALFFHVDDALGNFIPAYRRDDYILGYRRTAFGVAAGPRASIAVRPGRGVELLAAYGEGYRSPQAITLEDGERAPFTKVRSADLGLRWTHAADSADLGFTASSFVTQLSDDLVFEPSENRYERIGRTRRVGGMIAAEIAAWDVLRASASVTLVHATLLDPPGASAEDPDPPFRRGSLLPYVPPAVVRADVGARHAIGELAGAALDGSIGVGLSYVGRRPLPYSERADDYLLFDAHASLGWRSVELGLSMQNLLGSRYAASEYVYASNFDPESVATRLPARHVAAGAPRTILLSLTVNP